MVENDTGRPKVKVDGVDLNAFQVEYFDTGSSLGDIAVGVDISEFHSGGGKGVCGEWVSVPAGEELEFEHGGERRRVTFGAVQFEEKTPVLWFDRVQ